TRLVDQVDRAPCEHRVKRRRWIDVLWNHCTQLRCQPSERPVPAERDTVILGVPGRQSGCDPAVRHADVGNRLKLIRLDANLYRSLTDGALKHRRILPVDRLEWAVVIGP